MVSKIIKNVSKITRLIESGATEPLEGIIDDNIVIIKTFNNRWGNNVLINEFIGAARYLKKGYTDESIPRITDNINAYK